MLLLRLGPHIATNLHLQLVWSATKDFSIDSIHVCMQRIHTLGKCSRFSIQRIRWIECWKAVGQASSISSWLSKMVFLFSFSEEIKLHRNAYDFGFCYRPKINFVQNITENHPYSSFACSPCGWTVSKLMAQQLICSKLISSCTNGNISCRVQYQYEMIFHWDAHM